MKKSHEEIYEEYKEKMKKEADDEGGRTKFIRENMGEGKMKDVLMGISKMADKVGIRQDEAYKGKSKEEVMRKQAGRSVEIDPKMKFGKEKEGTDAKIRQVEPDRKAKPVKAAKGGMIKSSASKRADGCAKKGKTKGRMV
jgi:hypothetical protein